MFFVTLNRNPTEKSLQLSLTAAKINVEQKNTNIRNRFAFLCFSHMVLFVNRFDLDILEK